MNHIHPVFLRYSLRMCEQELEKYLKRNNPEDVHLIIWLQTRIKVFKTLKLIENNQEPNYFKYLTINHKSC